MHSTYSIRLIFLISVFLMIASFRPAEAQVMHLEIRVDPEFGLGDLIMPDLTAQAAPGDGLVETAYDHENAGQLTLHTTENVHLIVTLTSPDYLIRDKENRLPLDLRLAYAHPVFAGPLNLNPVADTTTAIRMNPGNLLINDMLNPPLKFETYLLLYGSVDVGMFPRGYMRERCICGWSILKKGERSETLKGQKVGKAGYGLFRQIVVPDQDFG